MKRILIVDDIDENLYLLRTLLEASGYEVEEARNGNEALSRAKAHMPDMIISDILMPEMDGFTFCTILKKDEQLKKVPFVFYTATYTDSRDEKLALGMGADAFIVKPTEPDEFMSRVEAILQADTNGKLVSPQKQNVEDEVILKEYNEVLIRKLEHKMLELEKTNKELAESELRFRTLADSGQALIWTAGPDKKCDYFNKPWLTFTGRTVDQELGDGWAEGVHPDDLERCFNIYTTAFDRRESFSIVYRLRSHDGTYRWILDDGKPRYDMKGDFIGYIGHCLDITERKQAEDELQSKLKELQRWYTAMLEREDRVLEMKKEVNDLLKEAGRPIKYGKA